MYQNGEIGKLLKIWERSPFLLIIKLLRNTNKWLYTHFSIDLFNPHVILNVDVAYVSISIMGAAILIK